MTTPYSSKNSALRFFLFITAVALLSGSFWLGFSVGKDRVVRASPFALLTEAWDTLREAHVHQPVDEQRAAYGAIKGLTESFDDPYTVFFTPEEAETFQQEIEGSFEGIGTEIGMQDEQLIIIAPIAESPAERAGLKAGDAILAIDGETTMGISLDTAVERIRGTQGTAVVLTIQREGAEPSETSITRETITLKSVFLSYPREGIALLRVSYFGPETAEDMLKIANKVRLESTRALVLDLRSNPGGYLDAAIDVASVFLPRGTTVVYEQDAQGNDTAELSNNDPILPEIPVVVLVDRGSASASEIVAGALQDAKRATLVGEKTFGKGTVQELRQLSDGSDLKITVARWLTPNKRLIDKEGIEPDVAVETVNGEPDEPLQKALELLAP